MSLQVNKTQCMALYLVLSSPSFVWIKMRNIVQKARRASCWPATVVEWVWPLSFLPCWLPSPPLYSIKSATPCSTNPWPTGSRHNGLKITRPLPWQQLPTPIPIPHHFTILHLQYARPITLLNKLCPMPKSAASHFEFIVWLLNHCCICRCLYTKVHLHRFLL